MRIVFLGSDPIALPLLDWLAGEGRATGATLVGVFTQPDRPVGRGQQVTPNGIKTWALAHGLPVHQPEKLTEPARQELAVLAPDLALVMAYGHILKDDVIATPRLGTVNLHASILPRYRGASPIQSAIANGESETGVALMRIVRALDAGPVADVERVPIQSLDTAADVENKLSAACVPLIARNLAALASGQLRFVEQDHAAATYCRRLTKADGALDFSAPARVLAARINGLFPWPGCSIALADQSVKLGLADAAVPGSHERERVEDSGDEPSSEPLARARSYSPGTVIGTDADGLLVATGEGVLRLRRLQRPGGRMLPASEFLRGFPVAAGTMIPSRPMPALVADRPLR